MFAYFLGGPLDLTKRATKQEPGTWMVPVKRLGTVAKSPADAEQKVAELFLKHEYRLMFREQDMLIYIYEGIR